MATLWEVSEREAGIKVSPQAGALTAGDHTKAPLGKQCCEECLGGLASALRSPVRAAVRCSSSAHVRGLCQQVTLTG
jgi:hypothetical protein